MKIVAHTNTGYIVEASFAEIAALEHKKTGKAAKDALASSLPIGTTIVLPDTQQYLHALLDTQQELSNLIDNLSEKVKPKLYTDAKKD